MNKDKPKSIRITGFAIAIVSALLLLNNMLGFAMAYYQLATSEGTDSSLEHTYFDQALAQAKPLALASAVLSLAMLLAGIYITRYKNWARVLAQVIALLFIIHLWIQMVFWAGDNPFDKGAFTLWHFVQAVAWSLPLVLLVWYLQKQQVRQFFT